MQHLQKRRVRNKSSHQKNVISYLFLSIQHSNHQYHQQYIAIHFPNVTDSRSGLSGLWRPWVTIDCNYCSGSFSISINSVSPTSRCGCLCSLSIAPTSNKTSCRYQEGIQSSVYHRVHAVRPVPTRDLLSNLFIDRPCTHMWYIYIASNTSLLTLFKPFNAESQMHWTFKRSS